MTGSLSEQGHRYFNGKNCFYLSQIIKIKGINNGISQNIF